MSRPKRNRPPVDYTEAHCPEDEIRRHKRQRRAALDSAHRARRADPLKKLDPTLPGFNASVYGKAVGLIMPGALGRQDDAKGIPLRTSALQPEKAPADAQAKSKAAMLVAGSLEPLMRDWLGRSATLRLEMEAGLSEQLRGMLGAAMLVIMGQRRLLDTLSRRQSAREDFFEEDEEAEEFASHIDGTEHFDWAEDVLLNAAGAEAHMEIVENFSDDF